MLIVDQFHFTYCSKVALDFKRQYLPGLVSARMELIFSPVAGTELYFEFRRRKNLITQWCCSCCWAMLTQSQDHFTPLCCLASEELDVHMELGEARTRTAGPRQPKGHPAARGSCPAVTLGELAGGEQLWRASVLLLSPLLYIKLPSSHGFSRGLPPFQLSPSPRWG